MDANHNGMIKHGMRLQLPALAAAALVTAASLVGMAAPAVAAPDQVSIGTGTRLGPGVKLSTFSVPAAAGTVTGHLVAVDLADPRTQVGLLHPEHVGQRETVSQLTADEHAVAGVNADFFNISESQHPGVAATGSSDGPEVVGGHALTAAVPDAQRFGPAMAPGTSTRAVIGVGVDSRARIGSLRLVGGLVAGGHRYQLGGLNQYALPEDSIGAFTSAWGPVSRARAVCGNDTSRAAPCTSDAAEITVRHGRVSDISDEPGAGQVPAGSTVLVGREAGAAALRGLRIGQRVRIGYHLASHGVPYRFAVGGAPILRDGAVLPGVDDTVAATRTGAGISRDGRRLYLVALDGLAETGSGLTLVELADLLADMGATDAVNLDGGGSTTCAAVLPGDHEVTVVSQRPPGSAERPVANGIAVWTHRAG